MKPEGPLPCSQQPATHPCPEILVQYTRHQHLHVEIPRKKLGQYSQSPDPCAPEQEAGVSTNEQRYSAEAVRNVKQNCQLNSKKDAWH
jgi:hypothetical protein